MVQQLARSFATHTHTHTKTHKQISCYFLKYFFTKKKSLFIGAADGVIFYVYPTYEKLQDLNKVQVMEGRG